jgi:sulfonate transport system permease protein
MWFGLGEAAKVTFIALVALFPVVVNTYEGIKSVAPEYVEVAKVFAFSRWRLLQRVVLPAATPSIITGIELAVIYAWLATIGAEYLMTTTAGVGSLLLEGREQFRMDIVLLGILATGLVGWLLSSGTRGIGAYLLRWRMTT